MPCGTMVSQFVLQALYFGKPADHGAAALSVLTSDAKNSWLNMLKQGLLFAFELGTRVWLDAVSLVNATASG